MEAKNKTTRFLIFFGAALGLIGILVILQGIIKKYANHRSGEIEKSSEKARRERDLMERCT